MPLDPEDLLVGWQQRAGREAEASLELSKLMQTVTATAESTGGEAVVTVDHSGGLSDLTLNEHAMRLSPSELSKIILMASRRAQARMAEEMSALVKGLYGSDSATTAFVAGSYCKQFPMPVEDNGERARR